MIYSATPYLFRHSETVYIVFKALYGGSARESAQCWRNPKNIQNLPGGSLNVLRGAAKWNFPCYLLLPQHRWHLVSKHVIHFRYFPLKLQEPVLLIWMSDNALLPRKESSLSHLLCFTWWIFCCLSLSPSPSCPPSSGTTCWSSPSTGHWSSPSPLMWRGRWVAASGKNQAQTGPQLNTQESDHQDHVYSASLRFWETLSLLIPRNFHSQWLTSLSSGKRRT